MLVLSRKKDQAIQIGDDIEVKILAIEGDQIKLGIKAPGDTDIYRKEIYASIQEENNAAASSSFDLIELLKKEKDS